MWVRVVPCCSYPHGAVIEDLRDTTMNDLTGNPSQHLANPLITAHKAVIGVKLQPSGQTVRHQECQALVEDCFSFLRQDGTNVPLHQREWRIGQSFSWHYVKNVEYRVEQLINALEDIAMANRKTKSRAKFDASSYVFVKCELNSEDKKAAKIWIEENAADIGPKIHNVVASDYKFTVSFSSDHDTFTACLVGKEDNAINGKKTLTARHKDWVTAALTVLYKHEVMFREGVWESGDDDDDDGWA